jgi:hypothetical protein
VTLGLFGREAPTAPVPSSRSRTRAPRNQPTVASSRSPRQVVTAPAPTQALDSGLDAKAVESFCALRAAVCLDSPTAGILWLVPEYTANPRPEISAADFARILATVHLFPGARVSRFSSPHTNVPASSRAQAHTSPLASLELRSE